MLRIENEDRLYRVELFEVNKLNAPLAEQVHTQLRELVGEEGATVIFDLDGIRFIDSAGFEVLQDIARLSKERGSQFKLCNITEDVKELIFLLELEGQFIICAPDRTDERILLVFD